MSATPRLYVADNLAEGSRLSLSEEHTHYLSRVLRLSPGDEVRVFNGRDGEHAATYVEQGKKAAALILGSRVREQAQSPDMRLLFAPLKKTRTDFLVEKAAELGVREIWPVFTERSDAERVRTDRLTRIAVEAAEQCERLDVPEVREGQSLGQALSDWDADRILFYCDESGDDRDAPWGGTSGRGVSLSSAVRQSPSSRAALLIGPEGGFSRVERDWLKRLPFVRPISLGPRILRAETAAAASLAIWQSIAGDWQSTAADPK